MNDDYPVADQFGLQHRRAEDERLIKSLRATLAKMEIALGQLDDPIVFLDAAGRIEWCNEPFCDTVGRRKIEMLGAPIEDLLVLRRAGELVQPEDHPAVRLRRGEVDTVRMVYELPDATSGKAPHKVQVVGRRVPNEVLGNTSLLVLKDVTERERNSRLDRLASVGSLTSGMIHQINSPLGFARSNIEFVRSEIARGSLKPEQLDTILDETLDGLDRISSLFSSVSAVSDERFRTGREFDLAQTVETAARLTMGHWDTVASLQIPPARGNTIVWGDPAAISQALVQLIANAAWAVGKRQRAEPTGTFHGSIVVSLRPLDDWCELAVRDNGVGIAEEHREKVFEPFFTTRRGSEAMGQGLYVARTIVEDLHGGEIWSDRVEEGTRIVIRLPAYRPE
jgi:signal transduction histidine kinase